MKKILIFLVAAALTAALAGCTSAGVDSGDKNSELVLVKGGDFKNKNSNLYKQGFNLEDFYIGRNLVTQKEWTEVMGGNPSKFQGDDLPVESVTWYDCIEYCNKRSEAEGLYPCYNIDKTQRDPGNLNDDDAISWSVTIYEDADGYRLPTEVEWEYAASGGQKSKNFIFSGSDNPDEVAWYYKNSGDEYIEGDWLRPTVEGNNCRSQSIGQKKPNELGIYDMSGNVREWCWDWYDQDGQISPESGLLRVWRGGCWLSDADSCRIFNRGYYEPYGVAPDQGFRVCRNG